MSGDLTIDDLAADRDADAGGSSGSDDGGDSAEWIGDLIDRLDEKGILDALIAQQVGADPEALAGEAPAVGGEEAADDPADEGADLDAETVATFGKIVIDQYGDVPISQVVKTAESQPEAVEQAIDAALGAGGEGA